MTSHLLSSYTTSHLLSSNMTSHLFIFLRTWVITILSKVTFSEFGIDLVFKQQVWLTHLAQGCPQVGEHPSTFSCIVWSQYFPIFYFGIFYLLQSFIVMVTVLLSSICRKLWNSWPFFLTSWLLDNQCTVVENQKVLLLWYLSGKHQKSTAILEGLLETSEVDRPFQRGLLIADPLDVRPVMNSTQNEM